MRRAMRPFGGIPSRPTVARDLFERARVRYFQVQPGTLRLIFVVAVVASAAIGEALAPGLSHSDRRRARRDRAGEHRLHAQVAERNGDRGRRGLLARRGRAAALAVLGGRAAGRVGAAGGLRRPSHPRLHPVADRPGRAGTGGRDGRATGRGHAAASGPGGGGGLGHCDDRARLPLGAGPAYRPGRGIRHRMGTGDSGDARTGRSPRSRRSRSPTPSESSST